MDTTIADEIRAWARRTLLGNSVITRNTEVHNLITASIDELVHAPWAERSAHANDRRSTPGLKDNG